MDKYLERIAVALETIAKHIANPMYVANGTDKPQKFEQAAPALNMDMPGTTAAPVVEPKKSRKTTAAPVAETPAAPVAASKPVELADVANYVRKLVSEKGHPAAKSVLNEFGAEKISAVKAEDFPKVISKITALLNAK